VSKLFKLEDVVSVVTGYFMSEDIGDIYAILNYMTGDDLFTHQLPRAADACRPSLIEQHPLLAQLDFDGLELEEMRAKIEEVRPKTGNELWVSPLAEWEHKGAIRELTELVGEDRVIVLDVEGHA